MKESMEGTRHVGLGDPTQVFRLATDAFTC